jgi:hypothetical protein
VLIMKFFSNLFCSQPMGCPRSLHYRADGTFGGGKAESISAWLKRASIRTLTLSRWTRDSPSHLGGERFEGVGHLFTISSQRNI